MRLSKRGLYAAIVSLAIVVSFALLGIKPAPARTAFISAHINSGTAYQYWKVQVLVDDADKTWAAIYEIEMLINSVDQATSGQATAGSEGLGASQAYDDNTGSKWQPLVGAADADVWVGQAFTAAVAIDTVRVYPQYGNGDHTTWIRVYADTQADFSTAVLLAEITVISASSWNTVYP